MNSAFDRIEARVGTVIHDRWRLDRLLGAGGMAAVYAATHRNGNRVALKILHPELAQDEDVRRRFMREGYAANSVGHPGAVQVLDVHVMPDGTTFLVMELLEGESLEARRQRFGGALRADEVLEVSKQALDVLVAAHGKGIVHRDLKPENLFLTSDGKLKILDFGLAVIRDAARSETTRAGVLLGTPAFMSPEAAAGKRSEIDARTDLWSLGATMFTLLTGEHVHEGEGHHLQLIAAATRPARPLASLRPDLPPEVHEVVDRAIAFARADRWTDTATMRDAVDWALVKVRGQQLQDDGFATEDTVLAEMPASSRRLLEEKQEFTEIMPATLGRRQAPVAAAPAPPVPRPTRPRRLALWLVLTSTLILAMAAVGLLVAVLARRV